MKQAERDEFVKEIKQLVNENIDLGKDHTDEEVREAVTVLVLEKARQRYLNVSEKKEVIDIVFNSEHKKLIRN